MERARYLRRILPRKRHAQRVGRAERLARREHAADRAAALAERALEQPPPLGDGERLGAHAAALGLEGGERTVRLRDRALRIAQRVARLFFGLLLFFQLVGERVD